jgi:hypothetical protein
MVWGGPRLVDISQLQKLSDELALKVRTLVRVETLREAVDTEEVVPSTDLLLLSSADQKSMHTSSRGAVVLMLSRGALDYHYLAYTLPWRCARRQPFQLLRSTVLFLTLFS